MVFQRRTYSVLLVSASAKFNAATLPLLPVSDFYPVTVAADVGEARRLLPERGYDIVLINAPLPDEQGIQLAIDLCCGSDAGVLLFVKSELYHDVYARVVEYGVMTLSKPTSAQLVTQTLRGLCATRERIRRMEARQKTVEEAIQEIRLVNRAKWQLIQDRGMTEPDAHRYIEKQAMDGRLSRRQVAQAILEGERAKKP